MTLYYSAATGGFYDDGVHSTMPDDAAKITAAKYKGLMAAQASGKQIVAGDDGKPKAVDPDTLLTDDQRLMMIRARRDRLLSACDYIMMPDYPVDDARANWASYRQALRDLPELWINDLANIVWPEAPTPS